MRKVARERIRGHRAEQRIRRLELDGSVSEFDSCIYFAPTLYSALVFVHVKHLLQSFQSTYLRCII